MRALTVCEPFATLICTPEADLPAGVMQKRIENRTWHMNYRGPLAIHAGKSRQWIVTSHGDRYTDLRFNLPISSMTFGAVLGLAVVEDCLHVEQIRSGVADQRYPWIKTHQHTVGPYCIVLSRAVRASTPIQHRGFQSLFDVPDRLLAADPVLAKWMKENC